MNVTLLRAFITTAQQQYNPIALTPIRKPKDLNHLQRRQQQRAISNDMIRVAIAYGQQRSDRHGAIVYTLSDRQLKTSPYAKFSDTLRGLQVICLADLQTLQTLTTYWNFDSKCKARKKPMSKLCQLQKRYSDRLHLKLTGGHSKYFVCDRQFAYVGSHNILSSIIPNLKIAYPDLQGDETGTIHRNLEMIQKLITRYDQAINRTDSLAPQNMRLRA